MPAITTNDGVEIFYKDWGKGQPIVVMVGRCRPLTGTRRCCSSFKHDYRVIAHDRRGVGRWVNMHSRRDW